MSDTSPRELDILTTSVGRMLVTESYGSLLASLDFDGPLNVKVTIDPTYGVEAREIDATARYLNSLPKLDTRIAGVELVRFPRNVGLQRALTVLLGLGRSRYALYFEDDWRALGIIRVRALAEAMTSLHAGMIALRSPTVAARGTFEREREHTATTIGGMGFKRLQSPSWAADYLPLHPHIHDAAIWPAIYLQALALDDDPWRCPDERVREYVRNNALHDRCPVWWTDELLVEDIGRAWAATRRIEKNIGPQPAQTVPGLPELCSVTEGRNRIVRLDLARSAAYAHRAARVIPGGTQTFMKRPMHFPEAFPKMLDKGSGAYAWDVDGNTYIDMIGGLGALSLGYAPTLVSAAVASQVGRGSYHSLPTLCEVEAAEKLSTACGGGGVRFFKSGADACSAAIRLARAATGRSLIASTGYHGCHDQFMVGTPGVLPEQATHFVTIDPFATDGPNALETVIARSGDRLAAYLLALPYDRVLSVERARALETATKRAGALLIFDEIVTGFRLGYCGAAEMLGSTTDARCFGKALAAGMPLAALVLNERLDLLMSELPISTTNGGETLSLATAIACIDHYARIGLHNRLAELGRLLRESLNARATELGLPPVMRGYPQIPWLDLHAEAGEHLRRARLLQAAAARRGVLLAERINFVNAAQDETLIAEVADRIGSALAEVAGAW